MGNITLGIRGDTGLDLSVCCVIWASHFWFWFCYGDTPSLPMTELKEQSYWIWGDHIWCQEWSPDWLHANQVALPLYYLRRWQVIFILLIYLFLSWTHPPVLSCAQ